MSSKFNNTFLNELFSLQKHSAKEMMMIFFCSKCWRLKIKLKLVLEMNIAEFVPWVLFCDSSIWVNIHEIYVKNILNLLYKLTHWKLCRSLISNAIYFFGLNSVNLLLYMSVSFLCWMLECYHNHAHNFFGWHLRWM